MDSVSSSSNIRDLWVEGSNLLIFSNSLTKWLSGTVTSIFNDEEGEWLEISYGKSKSKQIQRYNAEIQPTMRDSWVVGSEILIFSNSRSQWFEGTITQIFTDTEGEWLEINYDGSMLKQIQRYNPELQPTHDQQTEFLSRLIPPSIIAQRIKEKEDRKKKDDFECVIRQQWTKGDEVEVFDENDKEWYLGDIVDITDNNEMLNIIWARCSNNNDHYDAMFQKFDRFSKLIRPVSMSTSFNFNFLMDGNNNKNRGSVDTETQVLSEDRKEDIYEESQQQNIIQKQKEDIIYNLMLNNNNNDETKKYKSLQRRTQSFDCIDDTSFLMLSQPTASNNMCIDSTLINIDESNELEF